jgi:hypothetical protein
VNTPSSIPESSTLAGQNAMPTSMIRAGVNVLVGVAVIVVIGMFLLPSAVVW